MIKRLLQKELTGLLKQFPAVAILGPRQVGKTTNIIVISISQFLKEQLPDIK